MKFALINSVNINKQQKYKNKNCCDNKQREEEKVLKYRIFQHIRNKKRKKLITLFKARYIYKKKMKILKVSIWRMKFFNRNKTV